MLSTCEARIDACCVGMPYGDKCICHWGTGDVQNVNAQLQRQSRLPFRNVGTEEGRFVQKSVQIRALCHLVCQSLGTLRARCRSLYANKSDESVLKALEWNTAQYTELTTDRVEAQRAHIRSGGNSKQPNETDTEPMLPHDVTDHRNPSVDPTFWVGADWQELDSAISLAKLQRFVIRNNHQMCPV